MAEQSLTDPQCAEPDTRFAPRLYRSRVMHLRLRPKQHQFRYQVWCLLLDIDRLEQTARGNRLFSIDRFNLVSFRRADHGPRDGSCLRPWVEARLAEHGIARPHKIMLLSFARVLGMGFNPLSVYYCYDEQARLSAMVYEVKNTFGDQYPYVVPTDPAAQQQRHDAAKEFFVSPFIDMEKTYRFTLSPPDEKLSLRIKESDAQGEYLIATWNGEAQPLSTGNLARFTASFPLMGVKVLLGIHWEALKLFLKGVRFLGHPGDDNVVKRRGHPPTPPQILPQE
ncbi:MAG: DUF1365 domain-containing protein [Neomegalonema sp.]|nr:DUF1365 domain-containing protein [Neomegalonema sp.]